MVTGRIYGKGDRFRGRLDPPMDSCNPVMDLGISDLLVVNLIF